ncbi:hypothetical protein [Streptomyces sp. ME19-01-6]|uniref:hypothetical protein n=1 Tax=Streptomyces sp. ME19-01-6 TaxID=3028686 RepID=UPI0029BB1BFA|nr:hypothetical protein [Streptomyces sp. ME19-01-6]MDX3231063.1 hypothetical protein [Streptomyces sp. ME19-01-6]
MSDGFFYWYRQGWGGAADARKIIGALEASGLQLGNPSTGMITFVTSGPDSWGEQVPTTRDMLIESSALLAAGEVNFQLWLDGESDVFTRIRALEGGAALEFGLDGLTAPEQERVIRAVMRALCGERDRCVGFVVDRRGVTEEADWDSIVLRGASLQHSWPDALGVRPEIAAAHVQLGQAEGRVEPPLVVFGQRFGES